MEGEALQPVSSAFGRSLWLAIVFLIGFAVVSFGGAGECLLRSAARRATQEQAEVIAAALTARGDEDLARTVGSLQARSDRLVAVATLDSFGNLYAVYPDRPAHRAAILFALHGLTRDATILSPASGERITTRGIILPFDGGATTPSTKMLILVRCESHRAGLLPATAVFAVLISLAVLRTARSLHRWFDRQVAYPLRSMAIAVQDPASVQEQIASLRPGRWRETTRIAQQFEELIRSHAESQARTRRLERDARRQLRNQEIGFDRELRRAKALATTDPLTRLRNRAYLEEQLEPIFRHQNSSNAELSAVMIDVDHFKEYNDAHGHQVGDALLRFLGALLRGSIRPTDHAIRYGGDEFLLLLPGVNAEQAAVIAERMVKLFGQYTGRLGRQGIVSMSAGVASVRRDDCDTGQALLNKADAALYAAKRGGKNTVAGARAPSIAKGGLVRSAKLR